MFSSWLWAKAPKRALLFGALLLGTACTGGNPGSYALSLWGFGRSHAGAPGLAARINGSALSITEVSRHFHRRRLEQDGAGGVGREADALLLQQTLADLTERRLLTLAARQHHLAVFSAEVDVAWRQLTHKWDPEALTETLGKLRLSPLAIKEDLRESLLAQKYLRAMVLDRVAVLDRDIEVYLADHPALMVQPEQVRLRHIVVADAVAAKGVTDSLRRGETFRDVAAARSLAADAPAGGDLGLVSRDALPPTLADVVFALGVRKLSAPMPLEDGVHLFYVSEKFAQRPLTLAQARPRAEAILRREKESAALAEHLHALRQAAVIEPYEVTLEQI